MFRFEDISQLFYLGFVPVVALVLYFVFVRRKALRKKLGELDVIDRLNPQYSARKSILKNILLILSLLFLIFSMANPQWGTRKEKVKAQSADIYIALDISQSMMTQDISPSRMERAIRWTEKLVESLKGDRLGLIYFAGDAYLQSPLTNDYAAISLFVRSASTNLAGTQGTNIADAVKLASKAYEEDVAHQKAMIIITDGEDHEQAAESAIREARDKGLVVYTVGVGTEKGGFVPYTDRNGAERYKVNNNGSPVNSKINIGYLQSLAREGGGAFYTVNQGLDAIDDMKSKLDRLQRQEVEQKSFTDYNSYFQYFLIFGWLLCFIEWITPLTKRWWR